MTILSTIMGVESSGGHNVTQGNIGDINNRTGDLAQGYFQITGGTWAQFGGLNTGYTQANQAPYAVQLQIAQNIPVSRWGPDTQSALSAAGYSTSRGQTLGQLMAANNENPSATVAADGSTVSGSGSTIASGPVDNSQGSLPASATSTDPLGSSVTQNPSGASSTTSSGTGTAQGAPIQTALQPEEVSQIGTWISSIESAFGGGLKSVITAAETGLATYFGGIQNWFTRAGLIILGVVLLAVALVALMWDHGGKETVVNLQKAAAV
jgi:hypothetical protein